MVRNIQYIHFGCPICTFRTKKYEEYLAHVAQKGKWILGQFDVAVEILPELKEEIEENGSNE